MEAKDLKIETFRPEDAGSLNNSSRGVRITHKPTGASVTSTKCPTLQENKKVALKALEEFVGGRKSSVFKD